MYVLNVLYVPKPEPWGGTSLGPDIPSGMSFAQASDVLAPKQRGLIYLPYATPESVDLCVQMGAIVEHDANEADRAETDSILSYLATPDPKWSQDVVPLRNKKRQIIMAARGEGRDLTPSEKSRVDTIIRTVSDFESIYIDARQKNATRDLALKAKQACARVEAEERRVRAVDAARDIAIRLGIVAAAAFIAKGLGLPYGLALTLLHSDNFNRSNRSLSGDTMSDSTGAWATNHASYPSIASQVVSDDGAGGGSGWRAAVDSVMSDVDVQRSTVSWLNWLSGPTVRSDSTNYNGYLSDARPSSSTIYKWTSDVAANLGSDASGNSAADTIAADADGSTIKFMRNGSTIITVTSETTYSTGKAGLRAYGAFSSSLLDDWQVEVAGGGSTNARLLDGLVSCGLLGGRLVR